MNCAVLVVALVVRAPFSAILLVLLKLFFFSSVLLFVVSNNCESGSRKTFTDNSGRRSAGTDSTSKAVPKEAKAGAAGEEHELWVNLPLWSAQMPSVPVGGTGTLENGRICHQITENIVALTSFPQHRKTGASCGIETVTRLTPSQSKRWRERDRTTEFTQKPARCLRRGKSNDVVAVV